MTRRSFILSLAVAAAIGAGFGGSLNTEAAPLPQSVNHTIQAVTSNDIQQILIRRKSDNSLQAVGYFQLRDGSGNPLEVRSVNVDLNGAQTTSIASFATSVLVPAMNAQ